MPHVLKTQITQGSPSFYWVWPAEEKKTLEPHLGYKSFPLRKRGRILKRGIHPNLVKRVSLDALTDCCAHSKDHLEFCYFF